MSVTMPPALDDERESYLAWLAYLRAAVLRKVDGLDETTARWRPGDQLIPVLGVVNHLTHVEWRWIDGGFAGVPVDRDEAEFSPGPDRSVTEVVKAYRRRAELTEQAVRSLSLTDPCQLDPSLNLRWVLLHLINETARHAGHADATRELLDGTTGQ
jgi:uncharacterized damage-inducible protein DinB